MAVGLAWPYQTNCQAKCESFIYIFYINQVGFCSFFFVFFFTYKRIFAQPHLPSIAVVMLWLVDMTEPTQWLRQSWVGGIRSFVLISLSLSLSFCNGTTHHVQNTENKIKKRIAKTTTKTKMRERLVCKAFPRILPQLIKFSRMAQADNDSFNESRCLNWAQLFIADFWCFSYHSHTLKHTHRQLYSTSAHIHIRSYSHSISWSNSEFTVWLAARP